jgi:hypothetical protein
MVPNKSMAQSALTCHLGFWSAGMLTVIGVAYLMVVGAYLATHGFVLPPVGAIQLFGGIVTLLDAMFLVVLMASIHETAPVRMRILSRLATIFTGLFCAVVSINRFVQLSVVRQRISSGETEGIAWFLAYGPHSVMFSLEILGWGLFLGIACLFAAPLFSAGRLELSVRWLLVLYGILGQVTAIAFVLASPIAAVGLFAWGVVLPAATALLIVFFKRARQDCRSPA